MVWDRIGIGSSGDDCFMIFDGVEFAVRASERLKVQVEHLTAKLGRRPKVVTIYNPADKASDVYTRIKAKKASDLGIDFEAIQPLGEIENMIANFNQDVGIDGLMIQTPLVDRETDLKLVNLIGVDKDVDGLNPNSGILPATVRAVMSILATSPLAPLLSLGEGNEKGEVKVVVVGQRGTVGRNLMIQLSKYPMIQLSGMSATELNPLVLKEADVVISATGRPGLIEPEMLKRNVTCIDVGYPEGDFDSSCMHVADFFTPVPGGVGPVTVVSLFENLVEILSCR